MLLQCNNIEKRYYGKKVLDGITMEAKPASITVFIGPNGAGKTTLFKILGLLEKPDNGDIIFEGKTVKNNKRSFRKVIGMVFQYPMLLDRSVKENLAFGLKKRNETKIENRVEEMMQKLGLEELKDKNAREISGGEKKRVALGMVFILNTPIVLLDECFANLDPLSSRLLESLLVEMKRKGDTTIILSTHSMVLANSFGDYIYFMKEGKIINHGAPKILFEKPASLYEADYFGQKNIFAGVVKKSGDARIIELEGHLEVNVVTELEGKVVIYVPPSDILIANNPIISSALNNHHGVITGIESRGQIVCLSIHIGVPVEAFITRKSLEDLQLDIGKEVFAIWKASSVHVFKETENE